MHAIWMNQLGHQHALLAELDEAIAIEEDRSWPLPSCEVH
jgi:hypothetical protein